MRLYLINPRNPLVSLANMRRSRWNRYRVWKPLGLLVLAAMTPSSWEITVIDENLGPPDYATLPRPDLVGVTAFTSQACRAYEVADAFRSRGVPVVMGGIHATMRRDEAMAHVDAVVTGEAEGVWGQVLADAEAGRLQRVYAGHHVDMAAIPPARHDLLSGGYAFGSIQTTRGCPLNCSFCSVSAFNGRRYRHRPIDQVIAEMRTLREKMVLVVDDNLIGTTAAHLERAKDLFRAMIAADLGKQWICQVTINMGDDDELLALAARAGCRGVFIGFESPTAQGLAEVGKTFNLLKARDLRQSVRRIQRHRILGRVCGNLLRRRRPLVALVSNLSYRNNARLTRASYTARDLQRGTRASCPPHGMEPPPQRLGEPVRLPRRPQIGTSSPLGGEA
ncbi:MAG: B12-binding domain-containing radical SAM protein [Planctomycetota bacterium]